MSLIKSGESFAFNKKEIERGFAIWAKHRTWDAGITGFVSGISDGALRVNFCPDIGNVVNHYMIEASEVGAGEWEIRYSKDLSSISEYKAEVNENESE